jgi:hypothetical protein
MIFKLIYKPTNREIMGFAGIKGLVSQGERVKEFLESVNPDLLLISISPEEVKGLGEFLKDPFEMSLSDYEIIYGLLLSKFGEVMTPPPIYIEAVKFAELKGIQIVGIDMDEDNFQKTYSKEISSMTLVRHSLRKKKLMKKGVSGDDPYSFVDEWAKEMTRLKSFEHVEDARVANMLKELNEYIGKQGTEAIVMDYELFSRFIMEIEKTDQFRVQRYTL